MDGPELVRRDPAARLRGLASAYYGYCEEAPAPVRRREGPDSSIVVIVSFETEWWVGDALDPAAPGARHASFVGGLHDAQVLTEHAGRSAGMQVNLAPTAARALLGVPMDELAHRTVGLDDLLGYDASLLVERLQEAPSWEARFSVLDAELATRLAGAPAPPPAVTWAHGRLRASRGQARVGELADELGWSRKRLAARFREHVGVPPKTFARILRFEHALELAGRGDVGWAELAFRCGYYDQSHLVHEYRAFTGTTPAADAPFLQDTVAAAA